LDCKKGRFRTIQNRPKDATGVCGHTPASEIARLKDLKIVLGMPVECFIQTSPCTVVSFLVEPLHDQISRAFREK
jgi:hypothetical protein